MHRHYRRRYGRRWDGTGVRTLTVSDPTVLGQPAEMPMAWWKLDEASGLTFYDSSGNGRNLSIAGGWSFQPASPQANGLAYIADAAWTQAPFRLEIDCTMTPSENRYIISKDSGWQSPPRQWILYFQTPANLSWYVSGAWVDVPLGDLPPIIEHLDCGWDGSNIWLAVNGSSPITASHGSMYDTASPIIVGKNILNALQAEYHQIRYWAA